MSNFIDPKDLKALLGTPGLAIVDTRFNLKDPSEGRRLYQQDHIPGAIYLHLNENLSAPPQRHGGRHPLPDMHAFTETLERNGISSSSRVVAYDDSAGMFAGRLWWMLKYAGHEAVQVLDGGYSAWRDAGYDISQETPDPARGDFTLNLQADMLADADEIKAKLGNPDTLLVDARAAERYRGEHEPIDPKAGHIPSAVNLPFTDNLAGRRFKTASELEARFAELEEAEEIIVYCGSGVTAAHDLMALDEAGFKNTKLYAGSWSDWSSYDDTPIATGDES